jgi:hypothetical protein
LQPPAFSNLTALKLLPTAARHNGRPFLSQIGFIEGGRMSASFTSALNARRGANFFMQSRTGIPAAWKGTAGFECDGAENLRGSVEIGLRDCPQTRCERFGFRT